MPPGVAVADDHQAAPPQSPRRGGVMPQSPLRIKQDGKFYERLLTKDKESEGNLSFRYYWAAEPGSVPFVWETQPGTPRDVVVPGRMMAAGGGALPAITPPPSYLLRHGTCSKVVAASSHHHHQQSKKKGSRKGCRLRRIKIGFIAGVFRRLSLMKAASWRRPASSPVKVSSSSRWLFCAVATERGEHDDHHHHENETTTERQHKAVMCGSFRRARPGPWLPRFRNAGGDRGGNGDWD